MNTLRNIAFSLAALLTAALILASALESAARISIYTSPAMLLLWLLAAIAASAYLIARRRWLSLGSMLLHISLLVIVAGAGITCLFGHNGTLLLHTDGPPADIYLDSQGRFRSLPFELRLDSVSVASAASAITLSHDGERSPRVIAVNRPLSVGSIRVFQTSVRPGSAVFSVTDDPAGRTVTLAGYLLLAVAGILLILRKRRHKPVSRSRSSLLLTATAGGLLALQTAAIAVKWIIYSRPPMADGGEALQIMAWALLLLAAVSSRQSRTVAAPALVLACIIMIGGLVSGSWLRSAPMVPALQSPLLAVHVVIVMTAYALLAVMAVVSLRGLLQRSVCGQSAALARSLALPAVLLLCAGIFTGAVWAQQAWGRFWGWDPKETWALITLLLYSFPFHNRSFPALQLPRVTCIWYLIAFLGVVMTFFGVNYLLGGLHSYA